MTDRCLNNYSSHPFRCKWIVPILYCSVAVRWGLVDVRLIRPWLGFSVSAIATLTLIGFRLNPVRNEPALIMSSASAPFHFMPARLNARNVVMQFLLIEI